LRVAKKDLLGFPEAVVQDVGYALYLAQCGEKSASAKPLKRFGGAGVLEVVENHDGDTYRAVYSVRFDDAVYVLHCFQKKSKRGNATLQQDIEPVKQRLSAAEEESKKWLNKRKS
jgi:phage-related protein